MIIQFYTVKHYDNYPDVLNVCILSLKSKRGSFLSSFLLTSNEGEKTNLSSCPLLPLVVVVVQSVLVSAAALHNQINL